MGIQALNSTLITYVEKATPYVKEAVSQLPAIISKIGYQEMLKIGLVYQLFDSGLANFLGLETIRMGSTFLSYPKIQVQGGRFNRDSATKDPRNFNDLVVTHAKVLVESASSVISQVLPKRFRYSESNLLLVVSLVAGAVQPTIKVRYSDKELIRNEEFKETDYETDSDEEPVIVLERDEYSRNFNSFHLGITGSVIQGLNPSLFGRIYNKPGKFALGCVQLIAAIALTCIYCGIATSSPLFNKCIHVVSELKATHYIISNIGIGVLYITTW